MKEEKSGELQSDSENLPSVESVEKAEETEKKGVIDFYQAGVLTDRYLDTVLADWKNTGILLIQAPLLAFAAVAVFQNVSRVSGTLYFLMVISIFWIGCMNASREVVKERALFLRERMFNLDVGAYLFSKIRVLLLLGVVQVGIYSFIVARAIDLRIPIGWVLVTLLLTMFCGTCLGLLISALVKRSDHAVGLVPLVIIPQIVFSEFAIPKDQFKGWTEWVYLAMPMRWPLETFVEFGETSTDVFRAVGHLLPLFGYGVLFLLIAYPILRVQKY